MTRPHGNCKSGTSYVRTMPSTLSKVKQLSASNKPKAVVGKISQSIVGASSASRLPRSRQQSADCGRKLFTPRASSVRSNDLLLSLMLMCKESEGVKSSAETRFVRIVTNSPQPMAVLAYDWTLRDLEWFCVQPEIFTVLSVDPTFNLGSFHVTVSTYRHPMLQYRHGRKREQPVMFGPLFIHQCKNFVTYNFQLVGLHPSLKDLRGFGTDGETALENALHTQFKLALHLRCFLHFRGNLENKLSELGISKANAQEFIKDVFGNPALLEDGLVDAEASELDQEFSNLKPVWDNREIVLSGRSQAHFHGWFKKNCLEVVRKNMLKETREQAGLGSPPEPFYTNDVESKNRVLKQQTEYKPQELPAFVESMKNLFEEQKLEIEKAVIGSGEFKLLPKYRDLEVQQMEWYKKTDKQRLRVLERFNCAPLRGLTPKIGERG